MKNTESLSKEMQGEGWEDALVTQIHHHTGREKITARHIHSHAYSSLQRIPHDRTTLSASNATNSRA